MLYEIMHYCKNFFLQPDGLHVGEWTISNGKISLPFATEGQYVLITGSKFNNGVHKYGNDMDVVDETFNGDIALLCPPKSFLDLAEEIQNWQIANGSSVASAFTSESFGGYSYSRKAGADSWQGVFKARLAQWRKI